MGTPIVSRALVGALLALASIASGCGDDANITTVDLAVPSPVDAAVPVDMAAVPVPDLQPPPPDFGCYAKPMTHLEILNACTGAQAFDKVPVTPLRKPDGTLPPLP